MQENITVENPLNRAKGGNSREGLAEEHVPAYSLRPAQTVYGALSVDQLQPSVWANQNLAS